MTREERLLAMNDGSEDARCAKAASVIENHYGVSEDNLKGQSRISPWTWPRIVAYWLAVDVLGVTNSGCARWFNRTHGTVSHGRKAVRNIMETMPRVSKRLEELKRKVMQ